jgi:hypothetical protein
MDVQTVDFDRCFDGWKQTEQLVRGQLASVYGREDAEAEQIRGRAERLRLGAYAVATTAFFHEYEADGLSFNRTVEAVVALHNGARHDSNRSSVVYPPAGEIMSLFGAMRVGEPLVHRRGMGAGIICEQPKLYVERRGKYNIPFAKFLYRTTSDLRFPAGHKENANFGSMSTELILGTAAVQTYFNAIRYAPDAAPSDPIYRDSTLLKGVLYQASSLHKLGIHLDTSSLREQLTRAS